MLGANRHDLLGLIAMQPETWLVSLLVELAEKGPPLMAGRPAIARIVRASTGLVLSAEEPSAPGQDKAAAQIEGPARSGANRDALVTAPLWIPAGSRVYNHAETEYGLTTGAAYPCQLEGCPGVRVVVRWPGRQYAHPCTRSLTRRPDGAFRIA